MLKHRVNVAIAADKYVALYSGKVKNIRAMSEDGLQVIFPGSILQPYVSHEGVFGRFELTIDRNNKFKTIKKLN